MQRWFRFVVTSLLLLGGCASRGPNPRAMSVDVIEYVSPYQRPADVGTRSFNIVIENKSQLTFTVHSISVQAGTSDYEIDEGPQQVETAVVAGQSETFQILTNVSKVRNSSGAFAMDSLRLTIDCTDENGANFYETGTYAIRRQVAR